MRIVLSNQGSRGRVAIVDGNDPQHVLAAVYSRPRPSQSLNPTPEIEAQKEPSKDDGPLPMAYSVSLVRVGMGGGNASSTTPMATPSQAYMKSPLNP